VNERIRELAESCTVDFVDGRGVSLSEIDVEKFAELIVRECANVSIDSEIDPSGDFREGIAKSIRQYFGVEE